MRVSVERNQQEALVNEYRSSAEVIANLILETTPLIAEADELLLFAPVPEVRSSLTDVGMGLKRDAIDLERRGDFIIEADARLATMLNARVGDLVNKHLADSALRRGWTYDEAVMRLKLDDLRNLPVHEQIRRGNEIRQIEEALRILEAPHTAIGVYGDGDANFDVKRIGPPLRLRGRSPEERGRDLLIRALNDTADQDRILQDEFQAIFHENGNLTLVLPGVIDLSKPHLGYHVDHRSLRDTDQEALFSTGSTSVEDNGYAQRIKEWIELQVRSGAIPDGTHTTVVGHSFGADTALDLAADTELNGQLLNITHVFAAAYHNEPQFDDVPDGTQVVAAQNIFDLAVFGESIAEDIHRPLGGQFSNFAARRAANRMGIEGLEAVANHVLTDMVDDVELTGNFLTGNDVKLPHFAEIDLVGDRFEHVTDHILLAEFEGGISTDIGHHQDRYNTFLRTSDNVDLQMFFHSLDMGGYTTNGTTVSVDVSKPLDE